MRTAALLADNDDDDDDDDDDAGEDGTLAIDKVHAHCPLCR